MKDTAMSKVVTVPALVLCSALAPALAQTTQIVSVGAGGALGNAGSDTPVISADGRVVLFRSQATNLAPGDPDATLDVYARDLQTGATELVSVDSNEVHAAGFSIAASLSADGRLACFYTNAPNVVPGDGTDWDVFVRDRVAGTTTIVSVDSAGAHGNGDSEFATLSPDGRFVAFRSRASNLVAGDTNNEWDVFVRDLQTGTTERVNLGPGDAEAHGDSYTTSMSYDGRYVLFSSLASDLVVGDANNERDVFVRDRQLGITRRITVSTGGVPTNGDSHAGFLSADGRFATYVSDGTVLVAGDTNGVQDVFVHELATSTTTRVSVDSSGAQANGWSTGNWISDDGRYVAFTSLATNLVFADAGFSDVFLHDRWSGQTTRVGLTAGGAAPAGANQGGTMSGDGRYVTFFSAAAGITPSGSNGQLQIYRRDRGPAFASTPFCFGDGSGSACPCGNAGAAGRGCASSIDPAGASLSAPGTASLAADTLVLAGSAMPNASALYFQGTGLVNAGSGSVFGDGLRCAGGTVVRLATKLNVGGASQYPAAGDPPVSVRGVVATPGMRAYQVWYRNAAAFCTASTFNLTNGVRIDWTL